MLTLMNKRKSLSDILDGFNGTLKELESFIETKKAENVVLEAEIMNKQNTLSDNVSDINRADKVALNIKSIIGV